MFSNRGYLKKKKDGSYESGQCSIDNSGKATSYNEIIAIKKFDHYFFNTHSFSITTTRHQSMIRRHIEQFAWNKIVFLEMGNFSEIEKVSDEKDFKAWICRSNEDYPSESLEQYLGNELSDVIKDRIKKEKDDSKSRKKHDNLQKNLVSCKFKNELIWFRKLCEFVKLSHERNEAPELSIPWDYDFEKCDIMTKILLNPSYGTKYARYSGIVYERLEYNGVVFDVYVNNMAHERLENIRLLSTLSDLGT